MSRIKGRLLRRSPYIVSKNGEFGLKVSINELADFNPGDKVYQEQTDDGIILLIPEKLYLKNQNK